MTQYTSSCSLKTRVSGSGFDIVLIHGWGMNSGAFEQWLPLLNSEYRVTLIDLPGFGVNHDVLPQHYSLESVCKLVQQEIPEGAVIVGWSLGGLVAQQIAVESRKLLAGLITIASSPCFIQQGGWSGIRPEVLHAFTLQLSASYDKTLERFLAIQAMGSEHPKQQIKQLRAAIKCYPDPSLKALKGGLSLLQQCDLRQSIGKISLPTLRLYGKRDSLVPVSVVDAIHNLHPQSDNVILSDAAHAPFISNPEGMAQIIMQFVSGLHNYKQQVTLEA